MYASYLSKFDGGDEYMTRRSTWESIAHLLPRDKVIWEAFRGDGGSASILRDLTGCEVISNDEDFFTHNRGDIVVSNPPFSKKKEVLQRCKELNKPFILLMPMATLTTRYFAEMFRNDPDLQVIFSPTRIVYEKTADGVRTECGRPSFDSIFVCWRMRLLRSLTFLT